MQKMSSAIENLTWAVGYDFGIKHGGAHDTLKVPVLYCVSCNLHFHLIPADFCPTSNP